MDHRACCLELEASEVGQVPDHNYINTTASIWSASSFIYTTPLASTCDRYLDTASSLLRQDRGQRISKRARGRNLALMGWTASIQWRIVELVLSIIRVHLFRVSGSSHFFYFPSYHVPAGTEISFMYQPVPALALIVVTKLKASFVKAP